MARPRDVPLCFVLALGCEAKPLLGEFDFAAAGGVGGMPVYHNGRDWLVVAGVGKVAAAAATGFLAAKAGASDCVWLNVGIAGSGELAVGSCAAAHRVQDADSGESWYPTFVSSVPVPTLPLTTCSAPQTDYSRSGMFDMEAGGFVPAALRFSTGEWVHVFKVISDNDADAARAISAKGVAALIAAGLPLLRQWSEELRQAKGDLRDHDVDKRAGWLDRFDSHWRLTVYQRHRLERLLRAWAGRDRAGEPPWEHLEGIGDPQALLDRLETELTRLPVQLGKPVS